MFGFVSTTQITRDIHPEQAQYMALDVTGAGSGWMSRVIRENKKIFLQVIMFLEQQDA